MAGRALPKLPKSRACRSQDLSYHYGGPRRPRPRRKLTSERNTVNLSIYLPIYIYERENRYPYRVQRARRGGGGGDNQDVHAKFAKILLTIYLSIYLSI